MKSLSRIALLFCLIASLGACKKDHSVLGVNVQPGGDAYNARLVDTSTIFAYTVKADSTANGNDRLKFLGSNLDPYFGRTDVGLYMNANTNLTDLDFGGDATIRSAEIILAIDDLAFVGDPNAQLTYSVFALDSALSPARVYYTNNTKLHNRRLLLSTFTTAFSLLNGKTVVRIPISKDYGNAILTNSSYLTDNTAFQNVYKGFYITASGSNLSSGSPGAIYKCDLQDDISGFYLYYQNGAPSATKADKSFQFTFSGASSVKFTTVNYQPAQGGASSLQQQLLQHDSIAGGKEDLYLKGLGSTKVIFKLPYLTNYSDSSRITIGRAEIVLNVEPASFVSTNIPYKYQPPPQLALLPMDSTSRETYAIDQVDNARYDGNYDSDNKRYVFNIARYAQLITDGKVKNYGFYLVLASTDLLYTPFYYPPSKEMLGVRRDDDSRRVVLAGLNQGSLKPVLNFSFVRVKAK